VNLAEDCLELGQLDTALVFYNEALKNAERTNNYYSIGLAHFGMGKINERRGNAAKAINDFEKAFSVFKSASLYEQASDVAGSLSKAYENKRDVASALLYHKYYADLKDSSIKEGNDRRLQQLQFDYELEKKENKIKLLQGDRQMQQSKADKQRLLVYAFGVCLVLLLCIVLVLYRSRAMQQKTNELLLKQKQAIKEQVAELELLNEYRNKTFSILSHDLRGPINTFSSVIQLLKDGDLSEEDFRGYLPDMSQKLNSITLLIDNLLNWAKSSLDGGMVVHPADVKLCSVVEKNTELLLSMSAEKGISIKNTIPEKLTAYCDPGHYDIVIRNLLVNAVKFSYPGSEIEVAANIVGDKVELTVADKGVGMTEAQISRLFSSTASKSTYGTAGEKGTGIGLLLCFDYVKANDSTISVLSEPGHGTTFTLVLPAHAG
jgi:signal transduction histidine kinase